MSCKEVALGVAEADRARLNAVGKGGEGVMWRVERPRPAPLPFIIGSEHIEDGMHE